MPIVRDVHRERVYAPNQTDRSRINKALDIACDAEEFGQSDQIIKAGNVAHAALNRLSLLLQPPENCKTNKEPEQ